MSKRIDQPIEVAERNGLPYGFRWADRLFRVRRILDTWEEIGCWWQGEATREVFRVSVDSGGTFELHRLDGRTWRLYREFD